MLWEEGDPEPTMELLHQGISRMALPLEQQQEQTGPPSMSTLSLRFCLSSVELGDVMGPVEASPFDKLPNDFHFYRHVLVMEPSEEPQHPCATSCCTSTTQLVVLAVLSYNMAVLLHATALLRGSIPLLVQARHWYEGALVQLHAATAMDGQEDADFPLQLRRALWTNLGHVASLMEDGIIMDICWKELVQIQQQQQQQHPSPSSCATASSSNEETPPALEWQFINSSSSRTKCSTTPYHHEHFAAAA